MNRNYFYIISGFTILSVLLILLFFVEGKPKEEKPQEVQVENVPFHTYISGSGIVEPSSGNITISSPFTRTVEKIAVAVNDQVKKGDLLIQLNNQDLIANLSAKQKKYETTLSNFRKLEAYPRKEDVTIANEAVNKAWAHLNEVYTEYCIAPKAQKCLLIYKYNQAQADFFEAQAQLEKVQSGTWKPDLNTAYYETEAAQAEIQAIQAEIDQTTIKSPIDGTVLQIKVHAGETLDPTKTAMTLGNVTLLNLRVSIDQFNEQKFDPNCEAVAYKQGDTITEYPLKLIHVEPFMVPKKYLTNELREKVDTQTFEILYRIEKQDPSLFVGEQMDVYIYTQIDSRIGFCL